MMVAYNAFINKHASFMVLLSRSSGDGRCIHRIEPHHAGFVDGDVVGKEPAILKKSGVKKSGVRPAILRYPQGVELQTCGNPN